MALIGQAVSEEKKFEYYGNIHEYCAGMKQDEPRGPILFQSLAFSSTAHYHQNLSDIKRQFSPFKCIGNPMWPRSRSSQGHDLCTHCSSSAINCFMPSFDEIGPLVPEKKIFKGLVPYIGMATIVDY